MIAWLLTRAPWARFWFGAFIGAMSFGAVMALHSKNLRSQLEAERAARHIASLETAAQAAANKAEVQMKYRQEPPIDPEKRDELSIKLER